MSISIESLAAVVVSKEKPERDNATLYKTVGGMTYTCSVRACRMWASPLIFVSASYHTLQ